ncbi:putative secreted protein [Granulibacter bethesdensis]|uniref:DUF2155 domain-containing protein n=1 Tax=Granulibacter bethesdensis TaxID=364410 RepID=UPI0009095132|nr:DUF2155 domain-containing protein [Granulibacter bethesdensis]APH57572.1 putative secreted protein [Granulibacter bethesdensis]
MTRDKRMRAYRMAGCMVLALCMVAGTHAYAQPTSLQDRRPLPKSPSGSAPVDSMPHYDDPNDTGFNAGTTARPVSPPVTSPRIVPLPADPETRPDIPSSSGEGDLPDTPGSQPGTRPDNPTDKTPEGNAAGDAQPPAAAANPLSAYPWQPGHSVQLQILEKLSDRVSRVTLKDGDRHTIGHLTVVMRNCLKHAAEAPQDFAAWLDITADTEGAPRFSGWMLAKEPWVAVYESPLYDVRVMHCD